MSTGKSFLTVLVDRYGGADDTDAYDAAAFEVGVPTTKGRNAQQKKWEFVGMEKARAKQSRHAMLGVLGMQDAGIETAEDAGGTKTMAEAGLLRVRELNLSANPLLSAVEAVKVCSALPSLRELQLSETGFGRTLSAAVAAAAAAAQNPTTAPTPRIFWSQLTTLALNGCGLTWADLEVVPRSVPAPTAAGNAEAPSTSTNTIVFANLTSLHLEKNGIVALTPFTTTASSGIAGAPALFPALKELNLGFNALTDVGDATSQRVLRAECPNLSVLNISSNKLTRVAAPATASDGSTSVWASLESLFVADNPTLLLSCAAAADGSTTAAADPEPLAALEALAAAAPRMRTLKLSYDDWFAVAAPAGSTGARVQPSHMTELQKRMLTIAALPAVESLNSGPVRAKERLESELLYLQLGAIAAAAAAAASTPAEAAAAVRTRRVPYAQWPRMEALGEKHKNVVLSSAAQAGDGAAGAATAGGFALGGGRLHVMVQLTFRLVYDTALALRRAADAGTLPPALAAPERLAPRLVLGASVTSAPVEAVQRSVPSSMTVGKLRAFVATLFSGGAAEIAQQQYVAFRDASTMGATSAAASAPGAGASTGSGGGAAAGAVSMPPLGDLTVWPAATGVVVFGPRDADSTLVECGVISGGLIDVAVADPTQS